MGDSFSGGPTGLGNLADELAEAWDEDEEPDHASPAHQLDGHSGSTPGQPYIDSPSSISNHVASSPLPRQDACSLSPTKPPSQPKRRRQHSQQSSYDGSDYGSDPEAVDGIPPSLEACMAAIEHLARRGTEANGSDNDTVLARVAEQLKDLGSQGQVENGASRYNLLPSFPTPKKEKSPS